MPQLQMPYDPLGQHINVSGHLASVRSPGFLPSEAQRTNHFLLVGIKKLIFYFENDKISSVHNSLETNKNTCVHFCRTPMWKLNVNL